jgi:hypothetical protein
MRSCPLLATFGVNDPDVVGPIHDDFLNLLVGQVGRQRPKAKDIIHDLTHDGLWVLSET